MFVTAAISRRTALASLKRTALLASSSCSSSSSSSSRCCWASTLLLSEPLVGSAVPASTCAAVTAAHQLDAADDNTVDLLLVGGSQAPTQIPAGVQKVVHVQTNDRPTAETVATALAEAATSNDYTHVMGTSTKFGATVMPRAAALLGVSPVTDIVQILSSGTYSLFCSYFLLFLFPCSLRKVPLTS